jgi:hypothetical protein
MEGKRNEKMKILSRKVQRHFKNFYLARGTALTLKHGHRVSEDLDFLSEKPFSFTKLACKIRKIFNPEREEEFEDNIDFIIKGIKVSFVFFPFKNINPL